ncbi:MAG: hypothetical protein A3I29_00640 [Candidatus Magasanikbacteria bacterium RIFCSPLOWO2_02_FULL_44_11]|uniref:Uncharacterized protein n=1 Tax=Candidatus Magasanikbacteria bacterium RIFCSPLOWO2_02_FULL_44_11 TaxID=1798689 RepID=A0A1F6NAE5_9BACT|nr:MAG: hypothetical protein A3I29_00640 [Candidatus Magasanikbacteria bacterium RIFCSPLOWO2_02_FULL_44_11]
MDKIMEKLNKISLPATIIIASLVLGGFYYASEINKQKSIERQQQIKIDQEKQDQLAKELKEQETKEQAEQALSTCISDAEEKQTRYWNSECKRLGKIINSCVPILDLTFNEYLKDKGLTIEEYKNQRGITDNNIFAGLLDYAKRQDECSCALPISLADNANKISADDKAMCFKRYPQ